MFCQVLDLGLIEYEPAWRLQEEYAGQIAAGARAPTLLLLEHPHVYTLGRKGRAENLLWDEAKRSEKGVALHWVDRGGDITYHGPGQLVGYPLIPLGRPQAEAGGEARIPQADYVGYVRKLERTMILALARLGVPSLQRPGLTGVWAPGGAFARSPRCRPEDRDKSAKLAAIGVKVDAHGITRHGFALNVNPDMSYWDGIIACGLPDDPVASLAELLDQPPDMQRVKQAVVLAFSEVLDVLISASTRAGN